MERKKEKREEEKEKEKKEKSKEKPFTPIDFIRSKYGLSALPRAEDAFRTKMLSIRSKYPEHIYQRKLLKALCRMYTGWIQGSALCGNKRNRAYHLLKAVQVAVRTDKGESSATSDGLNKPSATSKNIKGERQPKSPQIQNNFSKNLMNPIKGIEKEAYPYATELQSSLDTPLDSFMETTTFDETIEDFLLSDL
ncbi:hypothetical protein NEFER03_0989 [Nematocida sp. LUAm3]|nr:hypothetical protein NEFER03_0989 [Nematocida sp. LUAm3]KAI5175407.1 hypothetical protein NEFER02_1336 [Nematocida sp. LUAm2]KAI5177636.1 hypothetical protein NEFER01_0860 [Nematocida sp. LUAm1]